ncbi:YwqH-like family protein [Oceanobacillus timonensis]|uniref:YwqH-like family protein n=1 Tax=Oceanobacillus timonensis TaxID=1926285 RepID=UPI0009B9750E|nr:DUF5082 family protein [Oceanobacillus timonensis]
MDSTLQTRDAELMNIQHLLGSNQFHLTEKQDTLRRLEEALKELTATKAALDTMKKAYLQPEFTKETFAGENSKNVNEFRHETLQDSFMHLTNKQMSQRIEDIQRQITACHGEISRIETTISSLESQQTELKVQRKKEIADY